MIRAGGAAGPRRCDNRGHERIPLQSRYHPFRVPRRRRQGQAEAGRPGVHLGRAQLRPDERPDEPGRAPGVEALLRGDRAGEAGRPRARSGRRHRRHRRPAEGTRRRRGLGGAGRHQRRHAVGRPRPPDQPRPGAWPGLRAVQRRSPAVPGQQLRPGHHRLRPAQRDRQGRRPARDVPRAKGGRPGPRAGVLRSHRGLVQADLRLPLVQDPAQAGQVVRQ